MDEIDREIQYEEALQELPIDEGFKWILKYVRETNNGIGAINKLLAGIFVVVLAIFLMMLSINWDKFFGWAFRVHRGVAKCIVAEAVVQQLYSGVTANGQSNRVLHLA